MPLSDAILSLCISLTQITSSSQIGDKSSNKSLSCRSEWALDNSNSS